MKILDIAVGIVALLSVGCSHGGGGGAAASGERQAVADTVASVPLPAIPDSIQSPEERAVYLVEHFWDAMDFRDRSLSLDTAFMEQSFSNFIALLPMVDSVSARKGIGTLVGKAAAEQEPFRLLVKIADDYLAHPNSPMRNEDAYIIFLKTVLDRPETPEEMRERCEYKLGSALKNRPGSTAPDFAVVTRSGRATTMHSLLTSPQNIVMFYDSDCENCHAIIERVKGGEINFPYPVVAIDVAGDRTKWDAGNAALPQQWAVAFAADDVEGQDKYDFPALPAFYLLNASATVLLKDFPL